jgi:hypothetical protein
MGAREKNRDCVLAAAIANAAEAIAVFFPNRPHACNLDKVMSIENKLFL